MHRAHGVGVAGRHNNGFAGAAQMGCAVNGPGEASAADIGIAGGKGEGLLFRKGEVLYKVPQEQLVDALMAEI